MDLELNKIFNTLTQELHAAGLDWTHVTLMLSTLAFFFALIILKRNRHSDNVSEQFGGGIGRIDKLEVLHADLKQAQAKALDTLKGELQYLKIEVENLRTELLARDHDFAAKATSTNIPRPESDSSQLTASDEANKKKTDLAGKLESNLEPAPLKVVTGKSDQVKQGLAKTRNGFFTKLKNVFGLKPKLDQSLLDEVEELLISSDLGVQLVQSLVTTVKDELRTKTIDQTELLNIFKGRILSVLEQGEKAEVIPAKRNGLPYVIMIVGVNGVGKTTTVGKLANLWRSKGLSVMVAAADTFRAAAVEQLNQWAIKSGVQIVKGAPEAKPATVVFDAMNKAKEAGVDLLIIDTAGRLHTKSNLMQELEGVRNMIQRHDPSAPHESWLVLDGTTGQNAISQANEFNAATPLTGLIVTKLDGTPKGGIVVAIKNQLGIPIRFIGVGEGVEQLRAFDAKEFVEALFDTTDIDTQAENLSSANAGIRRRRRDEVVGA